MKDLSNLSAPWEIIILSKLISVDNCTANKPFGIFYI